MSRMSSALVAATALVLTAGAVQFASGRDLRGTVVSAAPPTVATDAVNRAMKADRGSVQAQAHVAMQTFAIRPTHLIDTSVLVRVPVATPGKEANEVVRLPAAPSMLKSPAASKPTVACEPMVSVLTDVAKQLAPGRCLT